jgi:glucose/arabinose dehydrogenase
MIQTPSRRLPLLAVTFAEVHLPNGFQVETVADSSAVSEPMDINFAPDGAAWVTGRAGDLWRVDTVKRTTRRVGGVDTDVSGDRGLHGIAFHPKFPKVPHIFLSYHAPGAPEGKYHAQIVRWTLVGEGDAVTLDPASAKTVVEWEGEKAGQHVGGGLLAHPTEQVLYVTTGENNQNANLLKYCEDPENRAQSAGDLRGKVLRVGFDGSIPADNPFVKTAGAQPLVYTRGHRQPWSLSYDPAIGVIEAENGGDLTDDYDEINLLKPGGNYGWPRVFGDGWLTSARTNRVDGYTSPWFAYKRNTGASCTGAVIYRAASGGAYPSHYVGGLFYADFARKSIRFAPVDPGTAKPGESEAFAQGLSAGPVALRVGTDGALYFLTHGGATKASTNDTVARIVWKP